MLIIDFQQVMLSNLHVQLGVHTNTKIEPGLLKHMILNTLRSLIVKFKTENVDRLIVIACDNKISWRRQSFPYYKAARKKARDSSDLDWPAIYQVFSEMKTELKENFPYVVIDIEGAEADDIIGTLVHYYTGRSIIVSGDQDFIQLHNERVIQYDTIRKRYISTSNPTYLLEHILEGDRGDGVPNVLSDDDSFVAGKRQSPLRQKTVEKMVNDLKTDAPAVDWDPKITRNYLRNKLMIDLSFTPKELKEEIVQQFESQQNLRKSNVLNYMIANRMSNLLERVQEFS